jgi:transcriptional regulator with XRE-family HTH domain
VTTRRSPTVRRQRLGVALRRLREEAGLTIERVAQALECSDSKISRIETGQVSATPRDVRDMLQLYEIDDAQREELIQIAREARQRGWWENYGDVPDGIPAYVGLEAAATTIRTYMPIVVPALLQTTEYARAIIRAVRPDLSSDEVDRRIEFRIARQALLRQRDPPAFSVILDEMALRRPIGAPGTMHAQLCLLNEVAPLPTVSIQVLPIAVGEHAGMDGPFIILGFPERAEPDVVILDSAAGELYLEDAEDVRRYGQAFDLLGRAALTKEDSIAFITALAGELQQASR